MQQRHHLRRDAPRMRIDLRAHDHAAIELDDFRPQPEHAVEVGVAGAEVVERYQAAQLAQLVDAVIEVGVVGQRRFQHLDHDLPGPQAVPGERVVDLADARPGRVRQRPRVHVEEQPLVGVAPGIGRQVLQQRGAVEGDARIVAFRAGEQRHRRHRRAGGQRRRAQQRLVADHAVVRQAVDRLEVRGEPIGAVLGGRGHAGGGRHGRRRVGAGIGNGGHGGGGDLAGRKWQRRRSWRPGCARRFRGGFVHGREPCKNLAGSRPNSLDRPPSRQVEHICSTAGDCGGAGRAIFRCTRLGCNGNASNGRVRNLNPACASAC